MCLSLASDSTETKSHHQSWHGDCLRHVNASRVNYIDLDVHSRSRNHTLNVRMCRKVFKPSPSSLLWRYFVYIIFSQFHDLDLSRLHMRLNICKLLTCSLIVMFRTLFKLLPSNLTWRYTDAWHTCSCSCRWPWPWCKIQWLGRGQKSALNYLDNW